MHRVSQTIQEHRIFGVRVGELLADTERVAPLHQGTGRVTAGEQ